MHLNLTEQNLKLHESPKALCEFNRSYELRPDESAIIKEFFPPPPAHVLDLGVGNGRTTVPLHQQGYNVVGIEYCAELVEAACRNYPEVRVVQGDARQLNFRDSEFDVVWFSWNGIDYMYPYEARLLVLREAYRVLKPGGIFFLSSHNALGVINRIIRPWGLMVRGLQFVRDQLTSRRPFLSWYCVWSGDALVSPIFYSAPPSRQLQALQHEGWDVLAIRSVESPSRPVRWWRDVHINYVCRKI